MILDALAVLLVLLALVNVTSTGVLVFAAMRHHWAALEERATMAVILAFIALGAATIGLGRLHILNLPSEASLAILAVGLVLVSVPSLVWLWGYWTGRFDE